MDLSVVLAALAEKRFEPLCHALPQLLTIKTLFLLVAASACQVSELHALCIEPPFLIQNPPSFCLAPNPAFLPKTPTEVALSSDIEISSFYPELSSPLERGLHLVCPVRALHIYLQSTALSSGHNRALFVHWDEGKAQRPVSKRWISSALTEAIRAAYRLYKQEHEVIRAHPPSKRGMAASWAEIAGVSALEICHAVTWEGTCTFARHYCLDLVSGSFCIAVLRVSPQDKAGVENTISSPAPLPALGLCQFGAGGSGSLLLYPGFLLCCFF